MFKVKVLRGSLASTKILCLEFFINEIFLVKKFPNYGTLQIVWSGKDLRLCNSIVIGCKTFTIPWLYASLMWHAENFSTSNNLQYMITHGHCARKFIRNMSTCVQQLLIINQHKRCTNNQISYQKSVITVIFKYRSVPTYSKLVGRSVGGHSYVINWIFGSALLVRKPYHA